MLFSLFALSLVHASVAASLSGLVQPTAAPTLRERSCTPPKSNTTGPVAAVEFEPFDVQTAQQYRYQKQVGANAGSMFVHEQWMDNTPFECAASPKKAEIDIAGGWGGVSGARDALESHWDTWLTEDYFENIAGMGVNTVRLPVGYWTLGKNWTAGTPFAGFGDAYVNSWGRVLRTIKWCEKYKLGVLVDLHGAPGSQNGQAHSGISDGVTGLWGNQTNIDMTQNILVWLADQFQYVNNVVGLELLNEPKYSDDLLNFYKDTIPKIRAVAKTIPIYLHDGFQLNNMATWVVDNCKEWQPIIVDNHDYFVFTNSDTSTPLTQITQTISGSNHDNLKSMSDKLDGNLIVGEMGCANADGQSVSDMDTAIKDYCQAQVNSYGSATAGWIFWAIKMSGCEDGDGNGWCFVGSVGKYLPTTFTVPSGQIASGGVTITGGTAPNSGSGSGDNSTDTSDSGSSSGSGSGSSSDDNDTSDADTDSSSGSLSPSTSSSSKQCVFKKKPTSSSSSSSNSKRGQRRYAHSTTSPARHHNHHRRELERRQLSNDRGYAEGHLAANIFASGKRELGMKNAYIKARMETLGLPEGHLEHFKRGFEEGHAEGLENWRIAAERK